MVQEEEEQKRKLQIRECDLATIILFNGLLSRTQNETLLLLLFCSLKAADMEGTRQKPLERSQSPCVTFRLARRHRRLFGGGGGPSTSLLLIQEKRFQDLSPCHPSQLCFVHRVVVHPFIYQLQWLAHSRLHNGEYSVRVKRNRREKV